MQSFEAAAVDLGSHSFHMIVARIADGQLTVLDRMRERVKLGAGLDDERNLTPEAMARALGCLERMGERLRGMPPERVRVVGTNTLRQARNAGVFAERAHAALGYPIETISGQEEARLIYLGVAQTTPEAGGRRLVIDIGGGSTECIVGDGLDVLEADSLYMGCVSYSLRYFADGELTKPRFRQARMAAALELAPIAHGYRERGWQVAVGCSGTVHAIHAVARANEWSNEGITLAALEKLRKALVAAGRVDKLALKGLEPDRRPVIAGGCAILEAAFVALGIERMAPSPGALREGVLYDLVGRIHHEDVRERTIRSFAAHWRVDLAQAARVERAALGCLAHAVEAGWQLDQTRAAQLLSWASRLCEIGLQIAHTGYHKHSAYIVQNAHMPGFSREDQLELAAMILGHRRKLRRGDFVRLEPERKDEVRRLTVLFRIAVSLHRSHEEEPLPDFRVRGEPDALELEFPAGWLEAHPLTAAVLEEQVRELGRAGFRLTLRSAA